MLYFSLIPPSGSRIALHKDKQLEIAHAVRYYTESASHGIRETAGYNTPNMDAPLRIFLCLNCEIRRQKTTFVNVLFQKFLTRSPFRAFRVGYKDRNKK